ncbi:FAD-dependent monooxygenase [Methylocapsa sp. S129]|uniref:FAD-dependent monooxygenase n=1 Tax=Methylocapsa sp. S129 TaxID=1641869 RepID=UPI00131C34D7|nr:FAD-dependent monooxygenase [Methylocapsa sp. S129]
MTGRALIVGAGIGGLTAALAIAKAGFEVAIFERTAVLEEFGAGLQLTPNATRILERLDALEAVQSRALAPRAICILRGRDGALLSRLPLESAQRRWGAPYLVIHRADLQRALVERVAQAPNITLTLGAEVGGVTSDESGVTIGVKRGAIGLRERGDFLIGADGLRSIIRERLGLGGRDEASFSGRVAFRAQVGAHSVAERLRETEVTLRLGTKTHLVHYPLREGAIVNLVAVIESGWRAKKGDDPWDGSADRASLARAFAHWAPQARALIDGAAEWRAWPLYDRPAIPSLASGRVALLGDAAHPMLPFLAQGAAQAIEDAGALADCLKASSDPSQALAAYSQRRAPRAARVQAEAKAQARFYHMSGPLALGRNLGMRMLGPDRLLRRFDWLYGA